MTSRSHIFLIIFLLASAIIPLKAMPTEDFVDCSPAQKLLTVQIHALGGGSTITQNYKKVFPVITNQNINMGNSWGIGAKAVFGIREYLGFGTSANVTINNYNIDMAILGDDRLSMSAAFLNNRFVTLNIPVFVNFHFNVARSVAWNVETGLFFSYGFAGHQKQRIYRAEINSMDEFIPELESIRTDYYKSPRTLFNSFRRTDIGFHIGTSLDFGPHLTVGVQSQFGFKNAAITTGVANPSIHNISLHALIGYRF